MVDKGRLAFWLGYLLSRNSSLQEADVVRLMSKPGWLVEKWTRITG